MSAISCLSNLTHYWFSLNLDSNLGKSSWNGKLGASDFPLAGLLDIPVSSDGQEFPCSEMFADPTKYIACLWKFISWIVRGETCEGSLLSTGPTIAVTSLLICHGQYEAAEVCDLCTFQLSVFFKISIYCYQFLWEGAMICSHQRKG